MIIFSLLILILSISSVNAMDTSDNHNNNDNLSISDMDSINIDNINHLSISDINIIENDNINHNENQLKSSKNTFLNDNNSLENENILNEAEISKNQSSEKIISSNQNGKNTDNKNNNLKSDSLKTPEIIYVSLNGTVNGDGSYENPYLCLEYAINNADNLSEIIVQEGNYTNTNGYKNFGFEINKTLTIRSNGTVVLDGENGDYLFAIDENGQLNLKSLTIINMAADTLSESDIINRGILNIDSCTLSNNYGFLSSISNYGLMTIENSIINSNRGDVDDIVNYNSLIVNNTRLTKTILLNYGNIIINNSYTNYGLSSTVMENSQKAEVIIENSIFYKEIYSYLTINTSDAFIRNCSFNCEEDVFSTAFYNSNITVLSSTFSSPISLYANKYIDIKYSSLYWVLEYRENKGGFVNLSDNWWKSNKGPNLNYLDNFTPETWIVAEIETENNPLISKTDTNISVVLKFTDGKRTWDIDDGIYINPISVRFECENGIFSKPSGSIINHRFETEYLDNSEDTLIYTIIDKERLKLLIGKGYTNYSIFVSPDGNDTLGDGSIENPYRSLQKALTKALNGNTIYLFPGVYNGSFNSQLSIRKNLTFSSLNDDILKSFNYNQDYPKNYSVEINTYLNAYMFYVVEWGTLNLKNINFNKNSISSSNIIVESTGGEINIENCSFENIVSPGIISVSEGYKSYGHLNMNNCRFDNIQGVSVYGTPSINIQNSTFTNSSQYPGLYDFKSVIVTCNDLIVENCSFIDNNLSAIYSGQNPAGGSGLAVKQALVLNSRFINNLGYLFGSQYYTVGVICFQTSYSNPTRVENSYFEKNTGYTLIKANEIINSSFIENTGNQVIANGDYYYGYDVKIYDSTFIGNVNNANTNDDYYNNGIIYNGGNLDVNSSVFINNTAAYGGAIYNNHNANIKNSIFINNTAKYLGDDLFNRLGTMNASSNWWGSNEGPADSKVYRFLGNLIIDDWVVMGLEIDNSTQNENENENNNNNPAPTENNNNNNENNNNNPAPTENKDYSNSFTVKISLNRATNKEGDSIQLSETIPMRIAKIVCSYGMTDKNITEIINGIGFVKVYSNLTNHDAELTVKIDNQVLNLTINNKSTKILMDSFIFYGQMQKINLTLINVNGYEIAYQSVDISIYDSTGKMEGTYELRSDENGLLELELNLTPDLYKIIANYKGNGYFEPASADSTANIMQTTTNLISYNQTYYGKSNDFYSILRDVFNNNLVNKTICYNISNGENYFIYYSNTDNHGRSDINLSLEPGNYSIKSYFEGDPWYAPSATSSNITINPAKTRIIIKDQSLHGFGEIFSFRLLDDEDNYMVGETVELIISQNNISQSFKLTTDKNSNALISINLVPGNYNLTAIYKGNRNYGPSSGSARLTVEKVISRIICDYNINLTKSNIIGVKLVDLYGKEIVNQSVNIEIYRGDIIYSNRNISDSEGMVYFIVDLENGEYMGSFSYSGNDWYEKTSAGFSISINRDADTNTSASLSGEDLTQYYGESQYFNITFKDDNANTVEGKVISVSIIGESSYRNYNLTTDADGVCRLKIDLDCGNYTINYKYDNLYYGIHINGTNKICVLKTPTSLNAENLIVKYGDWKFYEVNLRDINGNDIKGKTLFFTLSSSDGVKNYNVTTDDYGKSRIKIDFNPGTYDVDIIFDGDGNYYGSSNSGKIIITTENKTNVFLTGDDVETISKKESYYEVTLTDILLSPIKYQNIEIIITNVKNGINKTYNLITDSEGKVKANLNELDDGEYLSFVSYYGNDEYLEGHTNNIIRVNFNENETKIIAGDLSKYYKNESRLEGRLLDNLNNSLSNRNIEIIISNETYYAKTNDDGEFKLDIDLEKGNYEAFIIFKGDENYTGSVRKVNITVLKAGISPIEKIIKKGDYLVVSLVDADNNPITGEKIVISIKGNNYTRTTDKNGQAKLKINSAKNTYKTSLSLNSTKYGVCSYDFNLKVVIKFTSKITANNLQKYYKNSSQLIVQLKNEKNQILSKKTITLTVKNAKKTYTYKGTTGSNGKIKFNINIPKGTYSGVLSFNGDRNNYKVSKKITIKVFSPKISISSKKIKRNKYLKASFKDKDGKAIKNTKVVFKIINRIYVKTTNSKGIASLKISLKVGTYSIKNYFYSTMVYGKTSLTTKVKVVK